MANDYESLYADMNPRRTYTIKLTLTGRQWDNLIRYLDKVLFTNTSTSTDVARVRIKDALYKVVGGAR